MHRICTKKTTKRHTVGRLIAQYGLIIIQEMLSQLVDLEIVVMGGKKKTIFNAIFSVVQFTVGLVFLGFGVFWLIVEATIYLGVLSK